MKLISTAEALVLTALTHGEAHGYSIQKWLRNMSRGALKPTIAPLFQTLRGLKETGLVSERWQLGGHDVAARRKYYSLTGSGKTALKTMRDLIELGKP